MHPHSFVYDPKVEVACIPVCDTNCDLLPSKKKYFWKWHYRGNSTTTIQKHTDDTFIIPADFVKEKYELWDLILTTTGKCLILMPAVAVMIAMQRTTLRCKKIAVNEHLVKFKV